MSNTRLARWTLYPLIGALGISIITCYNGRGNGGGVNMPNKEAVPIVDGVGMFPTRTELPQAWDAAIRDAFWFTSQGSQIIPYSWFTWLEQAGSEQLFRTAEHMDAMNYLPMESSSTNPSGLPIGFALDYDKSTGQAWMGFTCAACHTNQVNYQGTKILVEGAPTLGNMVMFLNKLLLAMESTSSDDAKFERFARNVLGDSYSDKTKAALHTALFEQAEALAERQQINSVPTPPYPTDYTSFGRLDAFSNIENAATVFALGDLSNGTLINAPVSYPFLWGTHQSDVVQWNGAAPNTPLIGPMVRNIGEVVGVFGHLKIDPAHWWEIWQWKDSYTSTVKFDGLGNLEFWVKDLRSPQWPQDIFPPIDSQLAARGAGLYQTNCSGCHQVVPRDEEGEIYQAKMISLDIIGTDPNMATHAATNKARTLALKGKQKLVFFGGKFGAEAISLDIVANGIVGVILEDPIAVLEGALITEQDVGADLTNEESLRRMTKLLEEHFGPKTDPGISYKARPQNGIWATAPYLHNGSVPNLWELLQQPADRVMTFYVGSREFDPVRVGFSTDQEGNSALFRVLDDSGQPISGNSNAGHTYGTSLIENDKWALIEYMKSL